MSSTGTDLPLNERLDSLEGPRVQPYRLTILFLSALLFRLIYNAMRELAPDEAYYWVWSRHLSISYLDHPPMVAYLIWASTKLFGATEFAVRLPAALLYSGTVVLTTLLVRRLTRNEAMTWLAAIIAVTCPVLTLTATLFTPDTPLIFFVILGLFIGSFLFDDSRRSVAKQLGWWVLFGLCSGLAMLSKYPGGFLPLAAIVVVLTTREWRRELLRPGCYIAAILTIAIFSPVLIWNSRHGWASFRFQIEHGLGEDDDSAFKTFFGYIAGLLLTWTPVLLVLAVMAMVTLGKRYKTLAAPIRLALATSGLPLVLFAYSSLHKKVEANWPAMAFAPGLVVMSVWAAPYIKRQHLMRLGWKIAFVFTIVAHLPEIAQLAHVRISPANDIFGWRDFASQVDGVRHDALVVASNYQNAAELSFYLPGQPDVWSMNLNRRSNAYDYFAGAPDLSKFNRVAFVGCDRSLIRQYFSTTSDHAIIVTHLGQEMRKRVVTMAEKSTK